MPAIKAPTTPSTCGNLDSYQDIPEGILVQVSGSDLGADGLLTASGASAVIGKLRTAGMIPVAPNSVAA